LNVFLLGMLFGPYVMHRQQETGVVLAGKAGKMERIVTRLAKGLDEDQAQKLHAIFKQELPNFSTQRENMHALIKKMPALLRKPVVDQNALSQLMAEVTAHTDGVHNGFQRAFSRMAAELSLESRQKIAATLEKIEQR